MWPPSRPRLHHGQEGGRQIRLWHVEVVGVCARRHPGGCCVRARLRFLSGLPVPRLACRRQRRTHRPVRIGRVGLVTLGVAAANACAPPPPCRARRGPPPAGCCVWWGAFPGRARRPCTAVLAGGWSDGVRRSVHSVAGLALLPPCGEVAGRCFAPPLKSTPAHAEQTSPQPFGASFSQLGQRYTTEGLPRVHGGLGPPSWSLSWQLEVG